MKTIQAASISAFLFMTSFAARADEATEPAPVVSTKVAKAPLKPAVKKAGRQTSESLRGTRHVGIGASAGSAGNGLTGYGAETFYNVSPQVQLGLVYMQGEAKLGDVGGTEEGGIKTRASASAVSRVALLKSNFFLGNSFALTLGAGYRSIDWKIAADVADGTNKSLASAEGAGQSDSILVHAGIANYWTLDSGIFIGANWLGYAAPVASSYKVKTETSNVSPEDKAFIFSASENLAQSLGNLGSLSTYLTVGYQL